MQIEISRNSLIEALRPVSRAVVSHHPMPILQGIHIRAQTSGVTFTASNGNLTIQVTVPQDGESVKVERIGEIVVPSSRFYQVIRKLDEEKVMLEIFEPQMLTVASGAFRLRLCGMDSAEFPILVRADEENLCRFQLVTGSLTLFRTVVKQIAAAASTSENRPMLTGILIEYDKGSLKMTATDGIRLASRSLQVESSSCSSFKVIVPAKNLYEICKGLNGSEEQAEIEVTPRRLRGINNHLNIESVLLQGTFPVVKETDSRSYLSEMAIDRMELLKVLERVVIMADEQIIKVAADSDGLRLSTQMTGVGDVASEVSLLEKNGTEFSVSLNGKLLIELLRGSDCDRVRMRYMGKNQPLVILPDDPLDSSLYLMSSIRTPE